MVTLSDNVAAADPVQITVGSTASAGQSGPICGAGRLTSLARWTCAGPEVSLMVARGHHVSGLRGDQRIGGSAATTSPKKPEEAET
ncbi:hypothetical protein GCM10010442_15230 [Kitasatospora kifunensis]